MSTAPTEDELGNRIPPNLFNEFIFPPTNVDPFYRRGIHSAEEKIRNFSKVQKTPKTITASQTPDFEQFEEDTNELYPEKKIKALLELMSNGQPPLTARLKVPIEHQGKPPKLWGKHPNRPGRPKKVDTQPPPPPPAPVVKQPPPPPPPIIPPPPRANTPQPKHQKPHFDRSVTPIPFVPPSAPPPAVLEISEPKIPVVTSDQPQFRAPPDIPNYPDTEIDDICGQKEDTYLVKIKNHNYNEAKWLTPDQIKEFTNGSLALEFFQKVFIPTTQPYFNPLYLIPEKVLSIRDDRYLVKWTGLGYSSATWENEAPKELIDNYRPEGDDEKTEEPFEVPPIFPYFFDEKRKEVMEKFYEEFSNKHDILAYGSIGSICRLEVGALIYGISQRFHGVFLVVCDDDLIDLVANEMRAYTGLTVLAVPSDHNELQAINENAFLFEDKKPKFQIVIISNVIYDSFVVEMPSIHYLLAVCVGVDIFEGPVNLSRVDAQCHFTIELRPKDLPESALDMCDDSTLLHREITLVCPLLKGQAELYHQSLLENVDLLTKDGEPSRVFEVMTKLTSIANHPSLLDFQGIIMKMTQERGESRSAGDNRAKVRAGSFFLESGKMRVLSAIVRVAEEENKRVLVLSREGLVADLLELYAIAFGVAFVRIHSLTAKRTKLEDIAPEAKKDRGLLIIANFEQQDINWLSMLLDYIVVFDGVYNPLLYFKHPKRMPKKRDCLIIRLISQDTHEMYMASIADQSEEVPMLEVIRQAALYFRLPARQLVRKSYPQSRLFDSYMFQSGLDFQYLFEDNIESGLHIGQSKPMFTRKIKRRVKKIVKLGTAKPDWGIPERIERHRHKHKIIPLKNDEKDDDDESIPFTPKFLEIPYECELANTHDWSLPEIRRLFIGLGRYPLGKWEQLAALVQHVNIEEVKFASLDLIALLLSKLSHENQFPLLSAVVQNIYSRQHTIAKFLEEMTPNWAVMKLSICEQLLACAVLVSTGVDNKLLWDIWLNGLNPEHSIDFLSALDGYRIGDQEKPLITSKTEKPVLDLLEPEEIDKKLVEEFQNFGRFIQNKPDPKTELTLRHDPELIIVEDIFGQIAEELKDRSFYTAEAYQFMRALYRNGIAGSRHSPIIRSLFKTQEITWEALQKKLFDFFVNRADSPYVDADYVSLKNYVPAMPFPGAPGITINNFGEITGFHDQDYLYPVGYQSQTDDGHLCSILPGPVFRVEFNGSAEESSNIDDVGGDELFGISCPLVMRFLQALPGAEDCENYRPWVFETTAYSLSRAGFIIRVNSKERSSLSPSLHLNEQFKEALDGSMELLEGNEVK